MPEINIINEKELEEYQSSVSAYKQVSSDIDVLKKQKENEPELNGFFNFFRAILYLATFVLPIYLMASISNSIKFQGWFIIIIVYGIFIGWLYFLIYIGELLEKLGINNYLINILTFGNLNRVKNKNSQIQQKIDIINNEVKGLKEKIEKFESEIRNYYDKYLEDFFLENLYKKRSTSKGYEERLKNFSLMINEVKEINDLMVIEKCPLHNYEDYLLSKQIAVAFQGQIDEINKGKKTDYLTPLGKKLNKINKQKEVIPPEVSYHTARKIDWDFVNKQRGLIGSQGEQIAMSLEIDYLIKSGNESLANKVKNVAKEIGDGLGYDILSYFPDGTEKYIEVKSTSKSMGQSFYMSSNELSFLQEHRDQAFIHRVFSVNDDNQESSLQILSAEEILASQIIPKEYLIKL